MKPGPESDPQHDVTGEIMDDHSSLRDLLDDIETASSLESLRADARHLKALLLEHFEAEEQRLFPKVVEEEPAHEVAVRGFEAEHAGLLSRVEQFLESLEQAQDLAVAVSGSADLVAELRNHEERENEVIMDTFFRDTGISG
jgi:hemerythrin-like domain-containing protein